MQDQSYLDKKYFLDSHVYNCPFCNRNNVTYDIDDNVVFDWNREKECYIYIVGCRSCGKKSIHLSYENLLEGGRSGFYFDDEIEDIDSKIFYSHPTSFFTLDNRIHRVLRELIIEGEGCMKMNFLTGASACIRKTIYELLAIEKVSTNTDYEDRIKSLKGKFPSVDRELFVVLSSIQNMTSDKLHEQSWKKWDNKKLRIIIEVLKTILFEIYVVPKEKKERTKFIQQLRDDYQENKKDAKGKK